LSCFDVDSPFFVLISGKIFSAGGAVKPVFYPHILTEWTKYLKVVLKNYFLRINVARSNRRIAIPRIPTAPRSSRF